MEIILCSIHLSQTPDGDYVVELWYEGENKPHHVSTMSAEEAEFLLSARPDESSPFGEI